MIRNKQSRSRLLSSIHIYHVPASADLASSYRSQQPLTKEERYTPIVCEISDIWSTIQTRTHLNLAPEKKEMVKKKEKEKTINPPGKGGI